MKSRIVGYLIWAAMVSIFVVGHSTDREGLVNIGVILAAMAITLNVVLGTVGIIIAAYMHHNGETFPEDSVPSKLSVIVGTIRLILTILLLGYLGHMLLAFGYIFGSMFTYLLLAAVWIVNKSNRDENLP